MMLAVRAVGLSLLLLVNPFTDRDLVMHMIENGDWKMITDLRNRYGMDMF